MKIEDLNSSVNDLICLSEHLGYTDRNRFFRIGSSGANLASLVNFLEDNPGAIEAIYNWAEDNYSDKFGPDTEDLEDQVYELFSGSDLDYTVDLDYSGRGMFGKKSSFAIRTEADPDSELGQNLIDLGLSYDTMGKTGYIYYTKD
jgi:hypothetical protein